MRQFIHRIFWFSGFVALAAPSWADGPHHLYNKERATYFAAVCLETAPSFVSAKAVDERRKSWESAFRLQRPVEAVVGLKQGANGCSCYAGFRSSNEAGLLDMVVEVVVAEYEDHLLGSSASAHRAMFVFDKQEVVVSAQLHEYRERSWVFAVATREGACPA